VTYDAVSEHPLTYAAVGTGILFVVCFALTVLFRALRQARKLGYTNAQLKRIIRVSASCTLVPAITVLVGFLILAPMLGIPLSWWRLSVVGNTAYEIMAANIALSTTGTADAGRQAATGEDFILVMYVMAIGIMGGMVLASLLAKRIHKGVLKIRERDWRWSALGGSTYIATILIVFIVPMLFELSAALLTLVTSAALMFFFRWIIRKFNIAKLNGFAFTISTFAAIVLSTQWARLPIFGA
jgi:hypothetical protein